MTSSKPQLSDIPSTAATEGFSWLEWTPDKPIPFYKGASWAPWAHWDFSRVVAVMNTDECLSEGTAVKDIQRVLRLDHSFDGGVAFVPSHHAADAWSFVRDYARSLATRQDMFSWNGHNVPVDDTLDFSPGDDMSALYAHASKSGWWLLHAASCDADSSWLSDVLLSYVALNSNILLCDSQSDMVTEPDRVIWVHEDCHLADNWHTNRHQNPAYLQMLQFAFDDGAVGLSAARLDDMASFDPQGPKPWSGRTVAMTGALSTRRECVKDLVLSLGALAVDDVRPGVTHLLVGEKPGSKLTKARSQGISILTESDLMTAVCQASLPSAVPAALNARSSFAKP